MTLLDSQAMLARALTAVPHLALALTATWLDPLGVLQAIGEQEEEESDLLTALRVCRLCFPDVYARSLALLVGGTRPPEVAAYLCQAVSAYLVAPLHSLEQFRYGIPWEALGLDLDAWSGTPPREQYPRLAPVLDWLGFGTDEGNTNTPFQHTAEALLASLRPYGEVAPYHHLTHLLEWLTGQSGNSLVDCSDEMLDDSGTEALEWTLENIDFLNAVQQEAQEIVDSALRGLERLETDSIWREALQQNCKTIQERNKKRAALYWPAGDSASAATLAPTELLPIRGAAAPPD